MTTSVVENQLDKKRLKTIIKWTAGYGVALGSFIIAVGIVLVWQLSSVSFLIPSPLESASAVYSALVTGELNKHLASTFRAVGTGFLAAVVIGVPIGIFLGTNPAWRAVLENPLYAFFSIPKIILYPFLLIVFGIGVNAQSALAGIAGLFPLIINTMVGVGEINPVLTKVGKSLNANSVQMTFKIYLPSIAPSLVVGLRMAYSVAVVNVVVGELFATRHGLGLAIMRAYSYTNWAEMFGLILLAFLVAFIGNVLLWYLEKRLRNEQVL